MTWTKYTPGAGSRSQDPKLSVWKAGQLAFNKASVEKFNLSKFTHCVLYYDKDSKKIGIKPTIDEKESSRLKIKKYKWGYLVWAKNYVKSFGLPQGKTRQLHPYWDDKDQMIVANYG